MSWKLCKNILCIRADNMGDVIMTTPALRALKETFSCRITLLTSSMGCLITPHINYVDETIVYDLPWVKSNKTIMPSACFELIEKLKNFNFDAAIIFSVYSQSTLPSALLTYMAEIPLRLAYCRENPYGLLTDWIPDKEPYSFIQHQVKRDLNLVKMIGAETANEALRVIYNESAYQTAIKKLEILGLDANKNFVIAHPGVSETKREYPMKLWIETLNLIKDEIQIVLTGSKSEQALNHTIQLATGNNIFSAAGILSIEEFIAVIGHAALVVSVNTSSVHIAASLNIPVVVLYALTNPQHTPWLTKNIVLPFSVPSTLKSKNEVIEFVNKACYNIIIDYPLPSVVAANILLLLNGPLIKNYTACKLSGNIKKIAV